METNKNKAVFLDRDGVLIEERGEYNYLPEHINLNDDVAEALELLQKNGYLLVVITNQSGIARGIYSHDDVHRAHHKIENSLNKKGINITAFLYCPHHPSVTNCLCRKPDSLMIEKAIARFNIDPEVSYFIGDAERDEEAAKKAGVKCIRIIANSSLMLALEKILS